MSTKGVSHKAPNYQSYGSGYDLWQASKEKEKRARYVPVRKLKKERAA